MPLIAYMIDVWLDLYLDVPLRPSFVPILSIFTNETHTESITTMFYAICVAYCAIICLNTPSLGHKRWKSAVLPVFTGFESTI